MKKKNTLEVFHESRARVVNTGTLIMAWGFSSHQPSALGSFDPCSYPASKKLVNKIKTKSFSNCHH